MTRACKAGVNEEQVSSNSNSATVPVLMSSASTNQTVEATLNIVQLMEDQISGSSALSGDVDLLKMLLLVFIFFSVAIIKYSDKKQSR